MFISKTYEIITEESREHCEAADSGFEYESQEMSVDDLIDEMSVHVETSQYPFTVKDMRSHFWFTSEPDIDYGTGDETRHSWHIEKASDLELKKLLILLNRK
jgi:hypothetical protein